MVGCAGSGGSVTWCGGFCVNVCDGGNKGAGGGHGWDCGGDINAPQAVVGVSASSEGNSALVHNEYGRDQEDGGEAAVRKGVNGYQISRHQEREDVFSSGCDGKASQGVIPLWVDFIEASLGRRTLIG